MLNSIMIGITTIFEPMNFLAVLAGVISGMTIGALPGLSATMGAALIVPFTFFMEPIPAIAMLSALYCGATYGGSISAILVNTPGTPAAAVTTLDGYELSKQGHAGKALGTAVIASGLGGIFSVVILIFVAPQVAEVALKFADPEYFSLAIFGVSMVANISSDNELKNIIGGMIGIFLATVGMDSLTGFPRFTFGFSSLTSGIDFIPVMIGLFAFAEVLRQAQTYIKSETNTEIAGLLPSFSELWPLKWSMLRSAVIGTFVGILPAEGGTVASFIGYNEAKRWSKHPEKFGTGLLEGVAAPETANNAATGGAMVPTLTLGIPGSSTTAVILGGLMIQGLQPGPLLFATQPKFVYSIFVAMGLANILFLIVGLGGAKVFAQVTKIPIYILNPIVMVLCIIGSYSLSNNVADVWIMIITGLIGFAIKKVGFSPAPIVLGLVLGSLIEVSFRRAMTIHDRNYLIFFERPFSAIFLGLALLSILWPFITKTIKHRRQAQQDN
ncbi:MAG: tripartite tricarboxylate transporter permease [Bacillota bacterium]